MTDEGERRVWLVERTYSDDERNVVILTYATPDGSRDFRRERALTSFSGPGPGVALSLAVPERNPGSVSDPHERERYRTAVERLIDEHDPGDVLRLCRRIPILARTRHRERLYRASNLLTRQSHRLR